MRSLLWLGSALLCLGYACGTAQKSTTAETSTPKNLKLKQELYINGYSFIAYNPVNRWRLFFNPDSVLVGVIPPSKNAIVSFTKFTDQFLQKTETYEQSTSTIKLLQITDSVCVDTLAHESFPYQVTLKIDSLTLHGCGYNIYDTRINGNWRLTHLKGNLVPNAHTDKVPMITINGETEWISGKLVCNRISGKFQLRRQAIKSAPIAATRMACTDVVENLFLILLQDLSTYQVQNNTLLLTNAKGETMQFERIQ